MLGEQVRTPTFAAADLVRIQGKRMFIWRAVDRAGKVLDVLVQKRLNKEAALKLLRKLLKNQGSVPDEIVTDGRASYRATLRELGSQHRQLVDRQTYKDRRSAALAEWQSLMA